MPLIYVGEITAEAHLDSLLPIFSLSKLTNKDLETVLKLVNVHLNHVKDFDSSFFKIHEIVNNLSENFNLEILNFYLVLIEQNQSIKFVVENLSPLNSKIIQSIKSGLQSHMKTENNLMEVIEFARSSVSVDVFIEFQDILADIFLEACNRNSLKSIIHLFTAFSYKIQYPKMLADISQKILNVYSSNLTKRPELVLKKLSSFIVKCARKYNMKIFEFLPVK